MVSTTRSGKGTNRSLRAAAERPTDMVGTRLIDDVEYAAMEWVDW